MPSTHRPSTDRIGLSQRASALPEQPINRLMAAALANPRLISLAAGFVDDATLPIDEVTGLLRQWTEDRDLARRSLQYGSAAGDPRLRALLLEQTPGAKAAGLTPEHVVMTAGSNSLLHLVGEVLFDPGDFVLCAAPTYFVYLGLLQDLGVRAVGIASDREGMLPEALDERLRQLTAAGERPRVKAVYLIPYFDNPAATNMSAARREAIWQVIDRWSLEQPLYLISDDAYQGLRYRGPDEPTMLGIGADPERTITCGTFSKTFSPGIRVGWGILPSGLVEPLLRKKSVVDFGSPYFNQVLMRKALEQGLIASHEKRLHAAYRQKLDAMLDALDQHLAPIPGVRYERPDGGLYVWLHLPANVPATIDGRLWQACAEEGVLYVPGEFCYATEGEPQDRCSMRLSFGVQSVPKIREGIELLGRAVRHASAADSSAVGLQTSHA
jgi:2-aminoadipate transaminase